jgi:hypothetical protein
MTTMTKKPFETLPTTKTKNGYIYSLVKRSSNAAVYEQKVEKEINGTVGKTVGYEVFNVIVGKPYSLVQKHGNKKGEVYNYPAAEKFPGNEDFGKTAWSYSKKESAMEKFEEIK